MKLLVSVRCIDEVEPALKGGADVVDVKEPDRGSLGRADAHIIRGVVSYVAGRTPVNAAMGELIDAPQYFSIDGLRYVKWGLANLAGYDWQGLLEKAARRLHSDNSKCTSVAVAYADWQRANAPSPDAVCKFACENGWKAIL